MSEMESTQCSTMAAFLVDAGWEVHLQSNSSVKPCLIKTELVNDKVQVYEGIEISHDIFLDLYMAGVIKKRYQFTIESVTQSIYCRADSIDYVSAKKALEGR